MHRRSWSRYRSSRERLLLLQLGWRRQDPLMRWIGREVKHFLREAAVHLLFIVHVAAVPDSVFGTLVENQATGEAEIELMEDDKLEPTAEELECSPERSGGATDD
eukprot:1969947-Pleurochrysis_carterae.AAC.3